MSASASQWEDEYFRMVGLIAEVVRIADKNPFCPIGHVVEHVIPQLREALTATLEPSMSDAEIAALDQS